MTAAKIFTALAMSALTVSAQAGNPESFVPQHGKFVVRVPDAADIANVKTVLGCSTPQVGVAKSNMGYVAALCDPVGETKSAIIHCASGAVEKSWVSVRIPAPTADSRKAAKALCR